MKTSHENKINISKVSRKLAYLVSCYPTLSHTFILRELDELRHAGFEIEVCSIRRPKHPDLLGKREQEEVVLTEYLIGPGLGRRLAKSLVFACKHPTSITKMIRATCAMYANGSHRGIKTIFHLVEAIVLTEHLTRKGIRHIHNHFGNSAGTVAYLASTSGKVEYSLSIHGPDVFDESKVELFPEKLKSATFVRSISQYCENEVRKAASGAILPPSYIVKCGVDSGRYHNTEHLHTSVPTILCVGRLCEAKSQHLLLLVSRMLLNDGFEHRVVLIGEGPTRDKLERMIEELDLSSVVEMRGGMDQDQVRQAYKKAEIFVLPSQAEGIPIVLMEAMAMELPVISTSVAGIPELIEDGISGLLFESGSALELKSQIVTLLRTPGLGCRLGRAARYKVQTEFDLQINSMLLADVFKNELKDVA